MSDDAIGFLIQTWMDVKRMIVGLRFVWSLCKRRVVHSLASACGRMVAA